MGSSAAVLPSRYDVSNLKDADPRFYAAKEIVIISARQSETYVPPENGMIVPTQRRRMIVRFGSRLGHQIRQIESTNPEKYVAGNL